MTGLGTTRTPSPSPTRTRGRPYHHLVVLATRPLSLSKLLTSQTGKAAVMLESEHVIEGEATLVILETVEAEQTAGGVSDQNIAGLACRAQLGCRKMF